MTSPRLLRAQGHGLAIQVAEWPGEGEPLLCVHGITANCRSFDVLASALAPKHRVLAVDLRGRGLSDKPATGYSIALHRRDLEAVAAGLGLKSVAVAGHSLGAYIALALAAARPDLTKGLVLIDGGADLLPEQWAKVTAGIKTSLDRLGRVFPSMEAYLDFIKSSGHMGPWTPAVEEFYRYDGEAVGGGVRSRIPPEAIAEERVNMLDLDVSQFYPQVRCPVLVLRATVGLGAPEALVLPEEAVARLKVSLPQAEVVNHDGADHFSILVQPNRRRDEAIFKFLASG